MSGEGVTAGAVHPDDPCQVCDSRTAELRPQWAPDCGEEVHVGDEHAVQYGDVDLGPDADGDGIGDIALFGGVADLITFPTGLDVRSVATGEVIARLGAEFFPSRYRSFRLGPDADGDGLADLLIGDPSSFGDYGDEFDITTAGERPNPGHTYLYSPARDEILFEWVGEADCRALGLWVDLGPDVDGDGLADPLIADPGCVDVEQLRDPDTVAGSPNGHLTIYSGASDEIIQRWHAPEGVNRFADSRSGGYIPDQNGDGIAEVVVINDDPPTDEDPTFHARILDPTNGDELMRWTWNSWGDRPFALLRADWLGRDLTGDGVLDMVAALHRAELVGEYRYGAIGLLPGLDRPVGEVTIFSDAGVSTIAIKLLADVNGDGGADVLVSDKRDATLRIMDAWGATLWSTPLPILEMDVVETAVSRGYDLDGDGVDDFAVLDRVPRAFRGARVFLSSGLR